MKKLLALLLVLATLIPLGVTAKADVTAQPFQMLTWEKVQEGKYDNIYNAPLFWTAASVEYDISWNGASSFLDLAVKTKELFETRPKGTRFINFGFPPRIYMSDHVENYVYMDEGVDMVWSWLSQFLSAFSSIGGELDGLILDTEIKSMNADKLQSLKVYRQIVADPRYAKEIRPLLEERGFPFYEAPTEDTPEISSIHYNLVGAQYDEARAIWDRVMQHRVAEYLNEGVCQILWEYYPGALVSDFQSADRDSWFKCLSSAGNLVTNGGSTEKVGNTSNYNAYHTAPSSSFYKDADGNPIFKTPYGYNDAIYQESAFNMSLWEINQFKNIYASTGNKTISAWVRSYNAGNKPLAYSPYTTEIIYHLGMLNPQPFLGHVIESQATDVPYYERLDILSQQLHELSRVAGYSDRKPIEIPVNWNESFLLSGMYANGRNIWRITPDTTKVTLEAFQVEAADPTFSVGGKTITFPGGTIIADSTIDKAGSCGYWVETKASVTPIVTTDKNRFENFPALFLGFNDCQPGVFDYTTGNPIGAWEFTWNKQIGSTTKIISVGGNNVLTIDGDVTLDCVKLPANITAGDSYAKNQTWEATITVPENLPADAVIRILRYAGEDQKKADGGFKIENGTLYYSQDGEYVEMSKITPGTYIFRRVMDFNNPTAFRSSYYMFSDKGTVVAMAANIPTPAFTTITSIGFSTEKVTKAIHLDNFRISINGSRAADFEIYDARTGILLKDPNKPRATDIAYRLSWLNATNTTESIKLLAEIYEDGELKEIKAIKTIITEPGCDGVHTGIVQVGEYQSIKLKVQPSYEVVDPNPGTEKPTTPTKPTEAKPTGSAPTKATKPSLTTLPTKVTKPVATTVPTLPTESTPTLAPTQATETTQMTEVTQATSAPDTTDATVAPAPEKPKAAKANILWIVVVVVVILAGAGTGVFFFLKKKKQ